MDFSFILLGAGNSTRFKSETPKQYHKIAGKTLIDITLDKIRQIRGIKKILFVYDKNHKKYLKKVNLKNVKLIIGGKTRNESTFKALAYLKKNKGRVLIHDSARPNFSKKLINNIIKYSKKNKTIIPILSIQDALKEKKNKNIILNINRSNFFLTQTPQCFDYDEIFILHKKNKIKYRDDDFSLINDSKKVKFISGEKSNLKITDQEDFILLKKIFKSTMRMGIGFDVHRLAIGRKLYLGGVKIPSKIGTLGHSDGDPVLHSVIDAILGACKMGDIGKKFSDKNKKYKNVRSTKLIKVILKEIKEKNYMINNIDVNIITQSPKLKKFTEQITNSIATLCEIPSSSVNVKAKTTEKLGVIGQEKAIAAEVIISVVQYD
jgi:2-C-methyl-D-erythritol 4-phosphate cytidylyltransferase/2-C-methyl-D-erythritol 2,4-cyclodiphosphate synthase